jgi:hypothetical protein
VKRRLRLSAIVGNHYPEMDVPPVDQLLAKLQAVEMSCEAVIYPESGHFPRATIDWHAGHGFVLLCFDGETSRGHALLDARTRDKSSFRPGSFGRPGNGEVAARALRLGGTCCRRASLLPGDRPAESGPRMGAGRRIPARGAGGTRQAKRLGRQAAARWQRLASRSAACRTAE